MKSPHRLRDDPDLPNDLRDALDLERDLVDDYDLSGLRDKVVGGPQPPPASPFRWWTVVGISTITAALVTWALQPNPVLPPNLTIHTPVMETVPDEPQSLPHRTETVVDSDAVVEADPIPPIVVTPATPVEQAPLEPSKPQLVAPSEPTPIQEVVGETPPTPGGLKAELLAYNLGLDASERRDWAEAREAYSAYLETWPSGRLRTEAQLGLLTATVESAPPAVAEALAADLLRQGGLGRRAKDVQLVRAEALVQLGNCDDALAIVRDFRRESRVNSIRQMCKRARRVE